MNKKKNRSRGFLALTCSLLALLLAATSIVNSFRTDIDKFLGTSSTKVVAADDVDASDVYTYSSDYSSTTQLLDAIEDLGERMSEEGTVLLKNNGALPLTSEETQKLSLLGFSAYAPIRGGDMGSSIIENTGTDADTVDFVGALKAKGFKYNEVLESIYTSDAIKEAVKTEVATWGGTATYYTITSPAIGGYFSSKEPSQAALDAANADWKASMDDYNVMIVFIARAAGENRTYLPGEAGVDPEQNLNQTDPLGLSDDERDLINAAVEASEANGGKVIVMLNNANPMEVQEIQDNESVDAILEIGLPGGYGFYGVCDILSGEANPSGHLSDTYAVVNANSPAAQNYGDLQWTNADSSRYINDALVEAEDIYIGYRYYETRYADSVLGQGNAASAAGSSTDGNWAYETEVTYPFGYGLSYTTFEQKLESVSVDLEARTVTATVTVTNTGKVAGKDVVQLYVSVPYTEYDKAHLVEKSAIQLLDFGKTAVLEPGASETVTLTADAQYMTSYDSTMDNEAGTKGCYILDEGTYYFTVGNGAHEAVNNVLAAQGKTTADGMTADGDAANVQTWELSAQDTTSFSTTASTGVVVENQLADMDLNYWMEGTVTYLTRNDWEGTFPKTYEGLTATDEMLETLDCDIYEITKNGDASSVTFGANNGLTLSDLKGVSDMDDERWGLLMDQLELSEGMIRLGFGGTSTKIIESIMSPETIQNDGPNGIYSYTLGQYANTDASTGDPCAVDADDPNLNYKFGTMCNETVIGQTFNKDLAEEFGKVAGNYSLWANLTIWWSNGANIHRLPYNARNHEYYSEDPTLTSGLSVAFINAGNEYGVIIAPKHFAYNDTEINRTGVATFATEQAARELELRCFQNSFEKANALGCMTTYARIGCTPSNAHQGLLTNILRKEWGFKGLMSEDFIMDATYVCLKEAAVNGVTMSCNTGENTMAAVSEKYSYWTIENVSKDATLLQGIKDCMTYQAYALANSNAMDGYSASSTVVSVKTPYDYALLAAQIVVGALAVLSLVGYVRNSKKSEQA